MVRSYLMKTNMTEDIRRKLAAKLVGNCITKISPFFLDGLLFQSDILKSFEMALAELEECCTNDVDADSAFSILEPKSKKLCDSTLRSKE
ncbi:hypothetical protein AVEN_39190-1 [Araneus ventricosus]|uniref:Uncharacterized protein n=1 Tax=Araneus ventricosus TaxID=182803 RepID=A0A4Y2RBZ2_ARAVE|nr:hypothetical protein AVEN_39190-1 [Araneus ventricosus]